MPVSTVFSGRWIRRGGPIPSLCPILCNICIVTHILYAEWFRTSVKKLSRTYGMLHWTIWGREPGVHEPSLRYGSKLVYDIVYFLFTLVTVTCKYSTLIQLTYHFASYNSWSNWRPPTSMQKWHRRMRFCRTLTNITDVFWIISYTATILVTNSMPVSTVFPDRWIGRGGPVPWPARTPDLNPLHYFYGNI